jgi:hypothetical protein
MFSKLEHLEKIYVKTTQGYVFGYQTGSFEEKDRKYKISKREQKVKSIKTSMVSYCRFRTFFYLEK